MRLGLTALTRAALCRLPPDPDDGSWGAGHITNYAQNENGDVWDLAQLAAHLGQSVWQVRWCVLTRSTLSCWPC